MKLRNIFLTISCTALLAACSDDFLENKPQGSLSDGVMTSSDAIETPPMRVSQDSPMSKATLG